MQRPKIELEQTADIIVEIDRMFVSNGPGDASLLATVAGTHHDLDKTK